MNTAGISAPNNHLYSQSKADGSVGQTKHWTQSRTVRNIAGIAVLAVGALAGVAASFFASPFAVIVAAGAVTVVVGVAVVGYFSFKSHRDNSGTAMASISPAGQTPLPPSPETPQTPPAMPAQPRSYPSAANPYFPAANPYFPAANPYFPETDSYLLKSHSQSAYQAPPKYVPSANYQGRRIITCKDYIHMQEDHAAKVVRSYGYRFYGSSRDGNCYFDSVVNQCPEGSGWTVHNLRNRVYQEAVRWCNNYAAHYNPKSHSFENDLYTRLIFQNGLNALKNDRQWADAADSVFTARVLNKPVVVINMNGSVGFAVDAQGQFMSDLLNATRRLDDYRIILDDQFILLIFDRNHFMGVHPIEK